MEMSTPLNFKMATMMDLVSKVSPRALGNKIKRQISGLAARNGTPQTRIRNGLTKISKIAKETRFKKRQLYNFSATALLMISQNGQSLLHHAVDQILKPATHRGLGMLPFASQVVLQTMPRGWAERAREQAHAQQLEVPGIPKIIVTSPSGIVKDEDMLPSWEYIKRSNESLMRMRQWESSTLLTPVWRPRRKTQRWKKMRFSTPTRRQHHNQVRDLSLKQPRILPRKQKQPVLLPMKRHHLANQAREQPRKRDQPLVFPQQRNHSRLEV